MLSSLVIEGYRCFERFEIPELRRVNLFVGRNNAGKSTVLEAAGLFTSGGHPAVLWLVTEDRDGRGVEKEPARRFAPIQLAQFFMRHDLRRSARFSLSGTLNGEARRVQYGVHYPAGVATRTRSTFLDLQGRAPLLRIDRQGWNVGAFEIPLVQGALRISDLEGKAPYEEALEMVPNIGHHGVAREPLDRLAEDWGGVVGNAAEQDVLSAMQILEPRLERIVFTRVDSMDQVFVVLGGVEGRVPFTSLGEGAWRILSLSIGLSNAEPSSLYLIDEIDTGLHHSTLVKVWKLILTVARKRELQVFATSHSQDCLRALAELHAQEPELTSDFMLHYIDKDEPRARSFTAAEVEVAIAHDLELRG